MKNNTGLIFNIQRCSVHDGPGIRTTVFLKGCPLRCAWCQNPEGISMQPTASFDSKKCIGCLSCKDAKSPEEAAAVCPTGAKSVFGKEYTVDELIEIVLEDRDFYTGGGGVTFSGGEALLQADFVASAAARLKSLGIGVAVDTCGAVDYSAFEKVIRYTDFFLYDIKSLNDEMHRRFIGKSNKQILENFEKLCSAGAKIIVRVPFVGGFNATVADALAIKEFTDRFDSVIKVELLKYHKLGIHKYELIGRDYTLGDDAEVSAELFDEIKRIFAN